MRDLAPGERAPIDSRAIELRLEPPRNAALQGELGAMLVALDSARRVAPGFGPLDLAARELRPGVAYGAGGELQLDLALLPGEVERLLLIVHLLRGAGEGLSFRDFGSLAAVAAGYRFPLDLTSRGEAAIILLEIYRRADGWRMFGNGQGFAGGLIALRSALNLDLPLPPRREPPAPPRREGPWDEGRPGSGTSFSGSGFAIDSGHILTNAHVIEGARTVDISGDRLSAPAAVVFTDPRNDIALLRVDTALPAHARFRSTVDLLLGEDVIVLGFPLQGLLGAGPQATGGNLSALCGIANDTSVMQFTAPIASGNSGGPILDQSGLVIGLVHASLNLERIRQGGSSAENVNFGVKGAVVRAFLSAVGLEPELGDGAAPRSRAEIVREARAYIYRIRCEG